MALTLQFERLMDDMKEQNVSLVGRVPFRIIVEVNRKGEAVAMLEELQ